MHKVPNIQRLPGFVMTHASSSVKRVVVLFAFYVAASLPAEIAFAQSISGAIGGTVVDQQQSSVPGATVRMIDLPHTTGPTAETKTATLYSANSLPVRTDSQLQRKALKYLRELIS